MKREAKEPRSNPRAKQDTNQTRSRVVSSTAHLVAIGRMRKYSQIRGSIASIHPILVLRFPGRFLRDDKGLMQREARAFQQPKRQNSALFGGRSGSQDRSMENLPKSRDRMLQCLPTRLRWMRAGSPIESEISANPAWQHRESPAVVHRGYLDGLWLAENRHALGVVRGLAEIALLGS